MSSFADILTAAFAEQPTRGQVFWIANRSWQLSLYKGASALRHPGLVCCSRPTLAPGTSKRRAARANFGGAFSLQRPDTLNGKSSTFFLEFRKHVPACEFDGYFGRLHPTDLDRLNAILDPEEELTHGAN